MAMLTAIQQLAIFFKYSPKRQRQFEKTIQAVQEKQGKKFRCQKIRIFCETRWVEKHETIEELHELYEVLLACLDGIATKSDGKNWDTKTVADAHGFFEKITSSSFIVAFHCVKFVFGFTKSLSTILQGSEMDVLLAFKEIKLVKQILCDIRSKADSEFNSIYADMTQKSKLSGGEGIAVPRLCKRQTFRNNVSCPDAESYWRASVFIPYIDSISQSLAERFNQLGIQAMKVIFLLPACLETNDPDPIALLDEITTVYDMRDPGSLVQEYRRWLMEWSGDQVKPSSLQQTVASTNSKRFPNIYTILVTAMLMPCTSAGVERANSALKLIKTKLRSTMNEERLNALLLLYVHKTIPLNYGQIVDRFASKYPHRMIFSNPLHD